MIIEGEENIIRQVKRDDSERIWKIRNHPEVRKNSNNLEEFPFEQHDAWFEKKYFNNQDNHCFILEIDGEVIGYCRFDFDFDNDNYTVSIAINPEFHNKGCGSRLLTDSIEQLKTDKDIIAETIKGNIPSFKLFKKNNFTIFKEDDNSHYFKYKRN